MFYREKNKIGGFDSKLMKAEKKVREQQKLKQSSIEIIQKEYRIKKNRKYKWRQKLHRECNVDLTGILEGQENEN